MSTKSYALILLHLIPWSLAMGAAFYFAFIAVPMANKYLEGKTRIQFLRRNIKYYSPFFLLMMCIMTVTGAWRLTDYKIALGMQYFSMVSTVLIIKVLLYTVVIVLATYQSFALGLRVTGQGEKAMDDPVEAKLLDQVVRKMQMISYINLILMTVTAAVGLVLSRVPYFGQ